MGDGWGGVIPPNSPFGKEQRTSFWIGSPFLHSLFLFSILNWQLATGNWQLATSILSYSASVKCQSSIVIHGQYLFTMIIRTSASKVVQSVARNKRQLPRIVRSLSSSSSTNISNSSRRALASLQHNHFENDSTTNTSSSSRLSTLFFAGIAAVASASTAIVLTTCEKEQQSPASLTPAKVATVNLTKLVEEHDDEMGHRPVVYTSDQVAENDGSDGTPIWMSYGGVSLLWSCVQFSVI
jgi:hypothetical protein